MTASTNAALFVCTVMLLPGALTSCVADQPVSTELPQDVAVDIGPPSILELMATRITPATDALWGAEDPQTDAEWQALADAATATIEAFEIAKTGGSGPNDNTWAANDDWRTMSDEVIAAAEFANLAIAKRDIEALLDAGGPMYTPCVDCHQAYNPRVVEQ